MKVSSVNQFYSLIYFSFSHRQDWSHFNPPFAWLRMLKNGKALMRCFIANDYGETAPRSLIISITGIAIRISNPSPVLLLFFFPSSSSSYIAAAVEISLSFTKTDGSQLKVATARACSNLHICCGFTIAQRRECNVGLW